MEKIAEGLALGKPFEAIDSERAAGKEHRACFQARCESDLSSVV
jgi:hypothetical protein